MTTTKREPIEFEEGSGNVFANLGLKETDQQTTKLIEKELDYWKYRYGRH